MDFEFRKLNATDVFPMATIISKIGIDKFTDGIDKNRIAEIKEMASGQNEDNVSWLVGFDVTMKIVNVVLSNLGKCEKEIYSLLSSVSGKTLKEIKEMDIDVFLEMILAFVKKEEFKNFFQVALKFIK